MGHVFDFHDAVAYCKWIENPQNRFFINQVNRLMFNMIRPLPHTRILDIGCGTGNNLTPFAKKGMLVTGVDPSPYMLDITSQKLGNQVELHRAYAEDLPFEDNAFNYSCLVTTLEFTHNPVKAIEEACRVTKDKLFIGILNRYALKGIQLRLKGIFTENLYKQAHFFGIFEVNKMLKNLLGNVSIRWRTACHLPTYRTSTHRLFTRIEKSGVMQRLPFGAFVGIQVDLIPRFRTRPLSLSLRANGQTHAVTSQTAIMGRSK